MAFSRDIEVRSRRQGESARETMLACGIERFGPPAVLSARVLQKPVPGEGQLRVRVMAAGVGPWDTWVRAGQSTRVRAHELPVTLGSEVSGVVDAVGPGVHSVAVGDEVYGSPNRSFTDGYAEFALMRQDMLSHKPRRLDFVQAASMPIVACTAWQMLFTHADLRQGQRVLVLGGAGSVGAFAVQLARWRGAQVVATGSGPDAARLRELGAQHVIDARAPQALTMPASFDVVIDTVGGELQARAMRTLRAGGILVSAVSEPDAAVAQERGVRGRFFIVDVDTACLQRLASLVDDGEISPHVGLRLPLQDARMAHEMLEGAIPRPPGKIVLVVAEALSPGPASASAPAPSRTDEAR